MPQVPDQFGPIDLGPVMGQHVTGKGCVEDQAHNKEVKEEGTGVSLSPPRGSDLKISH